MERQLGTVCAAIVPMATTIGMAPARIQDSDGCGKTDKGRLCMSSPAGGHRPGVYKAHYARYRGGEITVKLGYEIRMKRIGIIAEPKWLRTKKTRNGYAAFSKRPARRPSLLTIIAGCLALSVAIEAVQLVMNAGRVVDVDDVIFNTIGGLVGCLLGVGAWAR